MIAVLLVVGLVLLVAGADLLVRGAATLARRLGMPALLVGLTLVAYGTSAPEVAVSVKASLAGQGDLSLGNVLGSNTFNVLFILGLSALIVPLAVSRQLIRLDVPVMIGVSLLAWAIAADGTVSFTEGILLLVGLIVYTGVLVALGLRDRTAADPADLERPPLRAAGVVRDIALALVGLVLLVLGAGWFVDGAVGVARLFGVSELVIGLTVVAAGTSMPEVATSVMASIKGERDIAVGNVVGSNTFNLLGVLGAAAIVGPGGLSVPPAAMMLDFPVMVAVALFCLPIFLSHATISRGEGLFFLGCYVVYTTGLVMLSQLETWPAWVAPTMAWGLVPAALVAALVGWWRHRRARP